MDIKNYKANKEWTKDFKFNGYWYTLSSLYDKADKKNSRFDFNVAPDRFDFNQDIYYIPEPSKKIKMIAEDD